MSLGALVSPLGMPASFSVSTSSTWHGEDMYALMRPCARYVRLRPCCAAFTCTCLMTKLSVSKFLNSALLSAFLNKSSKILQDFTGQRPCDILNAFACAVRPMPPMNARKGMHCFFSTTSSKYAWALFKAIPLIAWPHSYVFLKCTRRSTPIALHALLGLLASREYLTMAATGRESVKDNRNALDSNLSQ